MIFGIIMTLISAAALVIGISDGEILGIIAGLCGVPLGIWCVIYYRKNSKKEKERNKKQNQPERQISIDMDFDYDWRLMNDRIVKGMIVERKIYLNEINTLPGFTKISMYPQLMNDFGISYSELLDRVIQLAFDK